MSIRGRLRDAWKALAGSEVPEAIGLSILPHQTESGKWQPTDFKKQVQAYHDWVYACVRMIAYTAAAVPLRLYRRQKGNDEEITEHRFLDMMREVNPWTNAFELKIGILQYLEMTGNTYLLINPDRLALPTELWVLQSQFMKIVPDAQTFIRSYIMEQHGQKVRYDPEQIVHLKYPNPNDLWYGMSPIMAAAYSVDADEYIEKYRMGLFKRDAVPSAAIEVEKPLKKDERTRLESAFKAKYGGYEKSGGLVVLSGGAKFTPLSLSPKELDFLNSQNANMDKICGIFGVPSLLLSKTEHVNRSNMEAAYLTFLRDTIKPKLTMIAEKFNEKLIPRYGDKDLYCEFDNPVPEDVKQEMAERESRLNTWMTTVNEERDRIGLDPVEWGDKPLVPFNIAPLGEGLGALPPEQPKIVSVSGQKRVLSGMNTKSIFKHLTIQEKDARWRRFLAIITPQERYFARELVKYFRRQMGVVLANLDRMKAYQTKDPTDYIMFALDTENGILQDIAKPFWEAAMEAGALDKIGTLGLEIDWDMLNPRTQAYLERKIMSIKNVNAATREKIRQILLRDLQEGLGAPEMARHIREQYESMAKYRALRIARTEIVGAANEGAFDVLQDAGIDKKAWLTAMDERVRDNHRDEELYTGWIPLGELFPITRCMKPGDGPAEEVINCRCTLLP